MSDAEAAAFEAAIRAATDDDTPRLAYADWLDEHGDPDRAEYIRLSVESATITSRPDPPDAAESARLDEIGRRRAGLLKVHAAKWIPDLPGYTTVVSRLRASGDLRMCWVRQDGRRPGAHGRIRLRFRRGFPAIFDLTGIALLGWPCQGCGGAGSVECDDPSGRYSLVRQDCPVCEGRQVDGKGCDRLLAASVPVERIRLTDFTSVGHRHARPGHTHGWWRGAALGWGSRGFVPAVLFDRFAYELGQPGPEFASAAAARHGLNVVALDHVRSLIPADAVTGSAAASGEATG